MLTTLTGGWLARKLGQSRVIGEMVGGILLGPSVFGKLAPKATNALFPKASFATYEILFTAGLVLFLFLIGMELDYEMLYRQRKTALLAGSASILLPFALGAALAHPLRLRFCCPGHRQHAVCAVPRHRYEHYSLPGAGAHPGREGAAAHGSWHYGDLLRSSGRFVRVAAAVVGSRIDWRAGRTVLDADTAGGACGLSNRHAGCGAAVGCTPGAGLVRFRTFIRSIEYCCGFDAHLGSCH